MSATVRRPAVADRRPHDDSAEEAGFLPVIRRWWWLLAAAAIAAGAAGYFFADRSTPSYSSEVELLVGPINADIETLRAAGLLSQTYAELATSRPIRDAVKKQLGIGHLGGPVRTRANDVTRLISIRVTHPDRELGAAIANALAAELIKLSRSGDRPKPAPGVVAVPVPEAGSLRVIDVAKPGGAAVGASAKTIVPLAAIAGLLAALGLAVLFDKSRDRVGGSAELERITAAPFLGSFRQPHGPPLLVERAPESRTVRQLSLVAAKLALGGDARSLLVAGPTGDGEGRFTAELAAAISRSGGARVALVDADDVTAETSAILELGGRPGTVELLHQLVGERAAGVQVDGYLASRGPALDVLPHGMPETARAPEPAQAQALIAQLLEHADVVVVAAAAVDRSPSTLAWASAVDGTVLVVERNRSRRRDIAAAAESLQVVGATLLGSVLREGRHRLGRR
ncbi:MAG TPA: hypothetical protein VFV62_01425 [Gaiellaceae bacterium]|nr:hypothetical protein [Gaiellaceae bacterium]